MKRLPLAAAAALTLTMVVAPFSLTATAQPSPGERSTADPQASGSGTSTEGSFTLEGADAASYRLPGDVTQVWSTRYTDGTTQTRYQQVVARR